MTRRFLPAALAASLILAACSTPDVGAPAGDAPAGTEGGSGTQAVLASGPEPDSLNPLLGHARWGDNKIFEGLLRIDESLELQPDLATELPEVSADGTQYTFTLRDDVVFHDGEPLTADDVAFTYTAALDPEVASPVAGDLTALESVEALDDTTVRFTLSRPSAAFPYAAVVGIVPEHLLAGEDMTTADANSAPVGTGPYAVEQWRRGDQLVLRAVPDHHDGEAQVERVTFVFTDDDGARAARLSSGDVDAAVLPPQAAANFEAQEGFEVLRRESSDFRAVVMPTSHPVTSDPAIRQALHRGLDRQALIEGALAGAGRPAFSPLPPESSFYSPIAEVTPDPAAAQTLLEEAGWVEGADGVRERDGERATFTLMFPSGDTVRENLALAVAEQADRLGIEVVPEGLSWEAIEPRMAQDALIYGGGQPYDPDLTVYPLMHSSGAGQGFDNPGHYDSATVDRLLEEGRASTDEAARQRIYADLQAELAADQPWIFLAFLEHHYVVRTGLWEGWDVDLIEPHEHGFNGGPWWNLAEWEPAG